MPKTTRARVSANVWLLELGVEELPVSAIAAALEQLRTVTPTLLTAARLEFGVVRAFATPRRIGVIVSDVATRQRADVQELVGPPKSAAFDANSQPTQACLGFLKKWNARVEDIQIKETPRGTCIMVQRTLPALPAVRALSEVATALLGKLQFPKTMRWDGSGERVFSRPLRWIVSLYGAQVVPVTWGALRAGRATCASRNAGSKSVAIAGAAQYEATLTRHGIIIDPAARREAVQRALERQLKPGERLAPECLAEGTSLLEEVADLLESPASFRGQCDEKFAKLPREILIASMAKYQRVFAVDSKQGTLLPAFIAITNGKPGNPSAVRHVYETILGARLTDSLLFYQDDLTKPLTHFAEQTRGILVHKKLGSMSDKVTRLKQLSSWIAEQWHVPADERRQIERAAQLCKADLTTRVVYEFPSLQGTMGGIYHLTHDPGDTTVAYAIQDHYMSFQRVPRNRVGLIVALADRMLTLTGFFGVGIKPTGSADPYGLRRAANEILTLLFADASQSLSLSALIDRAIQEWGAQLQSPANTTHDVVTTYLRERFEFRQTARYDLVRAALAAGFDDVKDALTRIKALETYMQREPKLFVQACKVAERTRNIVRAVKIGEETDIDPNTLTEKLERDVFAAVGTDHTDLHIAIHERRYINALDLYAKKFSDLLERFFAQVMVNVDDPVKRANRLALLARVDRLISTSIADLTQVVLESSSASDPHSTKEAVPA